jgi:hypothetical protein
VSLEADWYRPLERRDPASPVSRPLTAHCNSGDSGRSRCCQRWILGYRTAESLWRVSTRSAPPCSVCRPRWRRQRLRTLQQQQRRRLSARLSSLVLTVLSPLTSLLRLLPTPTRSRMSRHHVDPRLNRDSILQEGPCTWTSR